MAGVEWGLESVGAGLLFGCQQGLHCDVASQESKQHYVASKCVLSVAAGFTGKGPKLEALLLLSLTFRSIRLGSSACPDGFSNPNNWCTKAQALHAWLAHPAGCLPMQGFTSFVGMQAG